MTENGDVRTLVALYEIRLQRRLFVTRPLSVEVPPIRFRVAVNGLDTEVALLPDELPRHESPSRQIVICQVSRIEIRVARSESTAMHHIVPIPSGSNQEYRDWQEAHRERSDACNEAA